MAQSVAQTKVLPTAHAMCHNTLPPDTTKPHVVEYALPKSQHKGFLTTMMCMGCESSMFNGTLLLSDKPISAE